MLCNVLNQNPEVFASSTSPLPTTLGGVSNFWSQSAEIKSDLAVDRIGTETRLDRVLRGIADSWYGDDLGVVFDKSRGWVTLVDIVSKIFEGSQIVCMVRDPRQVFASVLKRHREFPILSDSGQARSLPVPHHS